MSKNRKRNETYRDIQLAILGELRAIRDELISQKLTSTFSTVPLADISTLVKVGNLATGYGQQAISEVAASAAAPKESPQTDSGD